LHQVYKLENELDGEFFKELEDPESRGRLDELRHLAFLDSGQNFEDKEALAFWKLTVLVFLGEIENPVNEFLGFVTGDGGCGRGSLSCSGALS